MLHVLSSFRWALQLVNTSSVERRSLLTPLAWLGLPLAMLGAACADAATLRSELYELHVASPSSDAGFECPPVFMRVSNGDRLRGVGDTRTGVSGPVGRDRFALFEFFLGPDSASHGLSRVRFRNRDESSPTFSRLQAVFNSQIAGPHLSPAATSLVEGDLTVDLPWRGANGDVSSNEVVGLMFELAATESIESIVNHRLPSHNLRAEVEIKLPGGARAWATEARYIPIRASSRPGNEPQLELPRAAAVLTISATQHNAAPQTGRGMSRPRVTRSIFSEDVLGAGSDVCVGMRAREPPL